MDDNSARIKGGPNETYTRLPTTQNRRTRRAIEKSKRRGNKLVNLIDDIPITLGKVKK